MIVWFVSLIVFAIALASFTMFGLVGGGIVTGVLVLMGYGLLRIFRHHIGDEHPR